MRAFIRRTSGLYAPPVDLLTNPNIDQDLSGTVNAFVDPFADLNAWTGNTTVLNNVVTCTPPQAMNGGHSEWWDMATGTQLRFQWNTNSQPTWILRWATGNDQVRAYVNGTNLIIDKYIGGGGPTGVASVAVPLVNGTFYWFDVVISGSSYTVKIFADSPAGTKSATQVGATASGTIADASVATGSIRLANLGSAPCTFGGAFSNVCRVVIPAPPGWTVNAFAGVPAFCVSKTTKFAGNYSLSIFSNNTAHNGTWLQSTTNAAATHTLSGRIKTSNVVVGAGAGAVLLDNNGGNQTGQFYGTNDWTVRSATGAFLVNVGTRAQLDRASGTAWFDNLRLVKGSR